jgi:phosphoribosylformylglycinamidine cyclo-ligase
MPLPPNDRYYARGVSSSKGEVKSATEKLSKGLFPRAFCRIVPDLAGSESEFCSILHSDDVGTKTALAYLAWKEGLGLSVWSGIAQDSLVMNIDDCACVGACGPFLAVNTIARNAKVVSGEVVSAIIEGYRSFAEHLAKWDIRCSLVGGETSDCGDVIRTVFVESTVFTQVLRRSIVDAGRITPGDLLIGFSSSGQAAWEEEPNSGIGSNGLTSARHESLKMEYRDSYAETFAPEIDPGLIYCGRFALTDGLPDDARFTVGRALLSPTRTYVPLIRTLLAVIGVDDIHAFVHCTGGGQTKILGFGGGGARGNRYVKNSMLPTPAVFRMLREATAQSWREMYRVFNMGHLLEMAVPERVAMRCLKLAAECGVEAGVIGHVEAASGSENEVLIVSEFGEQLYHT